MAHAEVVTKPIIFVDEVEQIQLTLDEDEARALVAVLAKVGGHPEGSRRGLLDNIDYALRDAGINHRDDPLYLGAGKGMADMNPADNIYFKAI